MRDRWNGIEKRERNTRGMFLSICQYLSRFGMPTIEASVLIPDGYCNVTIQYDSYNYYDYS